MRTRRKFLSECSLLAAVACLHPAVVVADQSTVLVKRSSLPGFAEFFAQVNTTFTTRATSFTTPLLLVAVAPLTAVRTDPAVTGNETFRLRFRGPAEPRLTQNTYALAHPQLGTLEIFITPVGRLNAADGHYEAVFDRPASPHILARQIARTPRREQTT